MKRVGIIGGGTAGMTAAIYAVRAGCSAVIFESGMFGGQIVNTSSIENYLVYSKSAGADYAMKLYEQCTALGVSFLFSKVDSAQLTGREKILVSGGKEYQFDAVIIANGAKYRKLGGALGKSGLPAMGSPTVPLATVHFTKGSGSAWWAEAILRWRMPCFSPPTATRSP